MVDGRVSWDSKIAKSWEGFCFRIVIFKQHNSREFTLIMHGLLVRSSISSNRLSKQICRYRKCRHSNSDSVLVNIV